MPGDYIKCPRCELNYIKKGEEYCQVCKAELKGQKLMFADMEEDDTEGLELCPVCHQNYIKPGESMCAKCMEEKDYQNSREDLDDDSWKDFLDEKEEEEDEEMLSLDKLAKEEGEFLEDEEEEEEFISEEVDDDDFEIPDVDQSDFEYDEDDEDDEDEDFEEDED